MVWAAILVSAFNLYTLVRFIGMGLGGEDLGLTVRACRAVLAHGWSHLYDVTLVRSTSYGGIALNPDVYYLSPPPLAWLTLPFALLPWPIAYGLWLVLSGAALVVAWWIASPPGRHRWLYLATAPALLAVVKVLASGQTGLFMVLAVAVASVLLRQGREVAAGLVLSLTVIKPHLALLVAPALLLAGYWRATSGYLAGSVVWLLTSVIAVGVDGLHQYLNGIARMEQIPHNLYFTLDYLVDPAVRAQGNAGTEGLVHVGALATGLEVACGLAALAAAYRARDSGPELPIVAALLGSVLAAPYLHGYDFVVVLLAFWLWLRRNPPIWQRAGLALPICGLAFDLPPWVALLGLGGWLALVLLAPPPADRPTSATIPVSSG